MAPGKGPLGEVLGQAIPPTTATQGQGQASGWRCRLSVQPSAEHVQLRTLCIAFVACLAGKQTHPCNSGGDLLGAHAACSRAAGC